MDAAEENFCPPRVTDPFFFVVILEGQDYDNVDTLIPRFNTEVEKLRKDESLPPWKRITAAVGCARFDHGKDTDTETVFKRADKVMYERKKQMKAQQAFL